MNAYVAVSFVLLALMSLQAPASAQTFQYSRGWTNGKRSPASPALYEVERLLSNPCHAENLKYILQGKAFNEKRLLPCDMLAMSPEADSEPSPLRLRRSAPDYTPQQNQPNFL